MRISDWSSDVCSSDLEKRPLPNNSKMMTPTTSQCQRLRPPISILRLRLRTYLVLLALRFQFQLAHLFQRGIDGIEETCRLQIVDAGQVAAAGKAEMLQKGCGGGVDEWPPGTSRRPAGRTQPASISTSSVPLEI